MLLNRHRDIRQPIVKAEQTVEQSNASKSTKAEKPKTTNASKSTKK